MLTSRQILAEQSLKLPAAPEELDRVHDALGRLWGDIEGAVGELPTTAWQHQFEIAVIEVAANVIEHAYGANCTGPMQIHLRVYPERLEALLIDDGRPWNQKHHQPADQDVDVDTLAESGYGLALAYATVDAVQYERTPGGHNEWSLVKHFDKPGV